MSNSRTVAYDGAIAVALAITLGVVFLIDRTRAPAATPVPIVSTPVVAPTPVAPRLKLAVTPHQYDDMGKLLDQLGSGFAYTKIPLEALEDTSKLVDYDVIFLTCGTDPTHWVTGGDLGKGDRPGVRRAKYNEKILDQVREAASARSSAAEVLTMLPTGDSTSFTIVSRSYSTGKTSSMVPPRHSSQTSSTTGSAMCSARRSSSNSTFPAGSQPDSTPTRRPSIFEANTGPGPMFHR